MVVQPLALQVTYRSRSALVELRTRSVKRALTIAKWGSRLKEFPPAEIEAICVAALRRLVLTGTSELTDEIFGESLEIWQRRRTSITALSGEV